MASRHETESDSCNSNWITIRTRRAWKPRVSKPLVIPFGGSIKLTAHRRRPSGFFAPSRRPSIPRGRKPSSSRITTATPNTTAANDSRAGAAAASTSADMCPTKKGKEAPVGSGSGGSEGVRGGVEVEPAWMEEARSGGSLKTVDLNTGTNGWASPPGDVFNVRGPNYLTRRQKSPANPAYLLSPLGVDWLRSTGRLDDVLGRPDNLVAGALRRAQSRGESLKAFILAVNLQVPGRDHHSAVFYFGSEEPLSPGSLLFRFVNGDDEFRNARFKIVNRIVRGPWIVRAAVGNYAACLLGRALQIRYVRGPNYLEIDVDIGSSALANAILHLALGYVTTVTIDMGFLVEGQAEEELPERLIGAVRIAHMEMGSAVPIGITESAMTTAAAASAGKHHHAKGGGRSLSKVKHVDKDGSVADEVRPNGAS